MPRPKNKKELIAQSTANFVKLMDRVSKMDGYEEFPEGGLNRNIRDVLAHLHEWHNMMTHWYDVGMSGAKPDMPKKGYTWRTVPDLNREINSTYSSIEYDKVVELLEGSHTRVMNIIETHSNEELFTKKKYKWTGSTSLGAYLISSTSSHYDWALKLIRKSTKSSKK